MSAPRILLASALVVLVCCAGACAELESPESERTGAPVETIDGWTDESLDLYFSPTNTAGEDRLAAEIAAAQSDIRVALYNLRSDRLGDLLLAKQNQGVKVEVLLDQKQMEKDYNTLDDRLRDAGLNIVPILNNRSSYATLHDKLAVIDGHRVTMGSGNWGYSGLHANEEALLVFDSPELATVVDDELDEIVTGAKIERAGDTNSRTQLYFSPEDRLDSVLESLIDGATNRIYVAVFSLRLYELIDALIRAKQRGVDVQVITDQKQAAYTDQDEKLRNAGITVIEGLNTASEFTAMHHKFMVVDGRHVAAGSYNWSYTATFKSYEDLAVIRDDTEVAAAFEGEFGRVWHKYAAGVHNPVTATRALNASAFCDGTKWGDSLVLVGDLPELGAWDPHSGVRLDGSDWPTWRASLPLRSGARFEYKLVVLRADGSVVWERGDNRAAVMPTDEGAALEIDGDFRW
jgi:phosphatidylserine/phosphatidylglycerophosphate/cardiolipin synthase-like enzyme